MSKKTVLGILLASLAILTVKNYIELQGQDTPRIYPPTQLTRPDDQSGNCVKAGCSNQLCVSEEMSALMGVTTCEFREDYACYASAACERQSDGECGWTMTPELQLCLSEAGPVKYY